MPELLSIKHPRQQSLPWVCCALALLCLLPFSAAAARFSASLDNSSILLGETVTLTLTVENGTMQQVSDLPPIDGLEAAGGWSSGMNTRMDQSGTTTVQTYSRVLQPTRAGEFIIPSFQATVDGQRFSSPPLTLKVAASEAAAPPAQFASNPIFLWVVPPKKNLYVGEVYTLEIRLYVRSDIRRIGGLNTPLTGDGFTISPRTDGSQVQRRIGQNAFAMIPLYFAITPVKTGTLTVSIPDASIVVNPRDPFDFFGPQPQQVGLRVDPVTFTVLPLPKENVPPTFTGAVGNYSLSATAGPTNVAAGDPVTVKIQITGQGAIDALTLPEQPGWSDFKTLPPKSKTEATSPLGVQGKKSFEQVILPQSTNITAIPPIAFSFFDPDQKTYRTVTQPAIPLRVRAAGSVAAPTIAATARGSDDAAGSRDIVPLKQRAGTLARVAPPLIEEPWFLSLQCVPLAAFLSGLIWRKRTESLANNPRRRRQRQVARTIRDGLSDLKQAAAKNDSEAFFATLFHVLQEQLGERLDLPASAITEAVIDERLRPRQVDESTLSELHELFQTCNLARYAPTRTSQELAALVPTVEAVVRDLQRIEA